ncbi:hypothetical protein BZL29_0474 [Mycobacterium kansasii]|uniref:Uncharacterized protein n=1 Tax=Mycobacterium kansasii TaxID=1768 RepID=A0A1V3XYT7_MYCKA|nr:hypothetical protein BZL29_0474 [Mycobacterium kansasii]
MSDAGFVAPGGDPLAPLSRLSELPPLGPRESRPQLPDLPAEPVGWNRRACRERAAARDATADRLLVATTLRLVLGQARLGSLPANWRERGLRDALTSGRDRRIWVWWKVLAGGPRVWEPGAAEALGLPWGAVLGAWRADTLMWLRETQVADRSSVSRWAGFQVVDATDDEWESLLDRAHSGRWPERGTDVKGPWNVAFPRICCGRSSTTARCVMTRGVRRVAMTWIGWGGIGIGCGGGGSRVTGPMNWPVSSAWLARPTPAGHLIPCRPTGCSPDEGGRKPSGVQ